MSQSWKKYGGLNHLDGLNHLTVQSITTDDFSLKYPYQGTFSISGDLFVSQNTEIDGNGSIGQDLSVDGNAFIREYLTMGTQYERGSAYSNFFYSDVSGIGLNVHNPQAALDVDSSFSSVLNVHTSAKDTRNILARNRDDEQIVLQITEEDARIAFSHKNSTYDIVCRPEQDQMLFNKKVIVGPDDRNDVFSAFVVTSAENSAIPFVSSIYGAQSQMSVAGHERSYDISTNTALLLSNTQLQGWYMGGGAYPLDSSKQMGFMGWKDSEGVLNPSQIQVSGNYAAAERTTTGYNTFQPSFQHTLDVNGPMRLTNEELRETLGTSHYLKNMSFSKSIPSYGIVSGSAERIENNICFHKVYVTHNYGRTWTARDISYALVSSTSVPNGYMKTILGSHALGSSEGILAAKDSTTLHLFTTSDSGQTWNYTSTDPYFSGPNPSTVTPYGFDLSTIFITENDISIIGPYILNNGTRKPSTGTPFEGQITSIDGIPASDFVHITTANGKIGLFQQVGTGLQFQNYISGINLEGRSYYDIEVDVSDNYIAACGENIISIQTTTNTDWVDISFDVVPAPTFRGITVYDLTHAVAVGDNGTFYYARNDITVKSNWTPVQPFMIEGMGNSTLLKDHNIFSVYQNGSGTDYTFMCDISDSIVNGGRVLYGYFPNIWFPDDSPYILTIGGHVETNVENLKMFDKTVKTLSLAAEADNVYLGAGGIVHMNESVQNISRNTNTYTNQLHIKNEANQGIYFDSMEGSKARIRPNQESRGTDDGTILADTTNTILIDGSLRIAGNLMLEGLSNIDLNITASFPGGLSNDLQGTANNKISVNFLNTDIREDDLKGAGFYIANYTESSNIIQGQRDGFVKISNQSVDKMSFRSIGHPSVVAIDFTNAQTLTPNRNSLMVLNQQIFPDVVSDTADNYYIRSSHCDNSIIDVSCAMQNIIDLSVNHDVLIGNNLNVENDLVVENNFRVEGTLTLKGESIIEADTTANGAFHILQTLTVDDDASFQSHVFFMDDVSMGTDLFVADHVGIGMPPSSSFALNVSGGTEFVDSVIIGGDVSMTSGDLYISQQVGIGTNPRTDYDLTVADDVLFESELVVENNATFQSSVDVSDGLGIGKSANTGYALDIEVSRTSDSTDKKAVHILEKGNGSAGAHGYDGAIILEHQNAGGYSSIVFPNTKTANDYGSITYLDDASDDSNVDVKYTNLYGSGTNGTLALMSQNDNTTDYDNVVVRPSGHLILDTGNTSSDVGGSTVIMPNGGNVGIGTTTPSTNLDVSGNSAFHGTASFQSGAVDFHDNVTFGANSDVNMARLGIGAAPYPGYALYTTGNVWIPNALNVGDISNAVRANLKHVTITEDALFKQGNTKFEDSDGSSGNVEVEGNLTVQKNIYVMGDRTEITTTAAVVKDPILMLGSWNGSGTPAHDAYDRGIFFDHVLDGGSTNVTGFMGYDQQEQVFRFKRAMDSGSSDVSNNKIDDVQNDQNSDYQEGTILARTFKSVSAQNIDKILLSENGYSGQWGGITTRHKRQVYNVENAGFSHLFTYSGTKAGGGDSAAADGKYIAQLAPNGFTSWVDSRFDKNLRVGDGDDTFDNRIVVNAASLAGTTFTANGTYQSNGLWGPFISVTNPLIPTRLVFNNDGQNESSVDYADGVKIFGKNRDGISDILIQEITIDLKNTLEYDLFASQPYTNIEFQFKRNGSGTFYVKNFALHAYTYEAHVLGGLNVDGNATIDRQLNARNLYVSAGSLGSTTGDEIVLAEFTNTNINTNNLKIINRRHANGYGWTSTSTRIQQITDTTNQGFLEFNPPNNQYGISLGNQYGRHLTMAGDGNVGIGTTDPGTKLHMKSGVFLAENRANTNGIIFYADEGGSDGDNNNKYDIYNAKFGSGIFINDTGETGSTITLINKESANNTTKHASIGFVNTDTVSNGKFGGQIGFWPENGNASKQQFRIYTSGDRAGVNLPVQQMVVTGDGNVGIGTTTPAHKLDVVGEINASTHLRCGSDIYMDGGNNTIHSSNVLALNSNSIQLRTESNAEMAKFEKIETMIGTENFSARIQIYDEDHSSVPKNCYFASDNHVFRAYDNTTHFVTINSNGLGVGTDTPLMQLDVSGSIRLGYWGDETRFIGFTKQDTDEMIAGIELESVEVDAGDRYSQNIHFRSHNHGVSNDRRMTVRYDGNVGIGTTSPDTMLHIHKKLTTSGLYPAGSIKFSTNNESLVFWDLGEIEAIVQSNNGTVNNHPGGLAFKTKPADGLTTSSLQTRMVIDANGNVGIGTTNPTEKLHIEDGSAKMVAVKGPYGAFISLTSGSANNNNVYYNGTNHYFRTKDGATSTGTGNLYTNNLYATSIRAESSGNSSDSGLRLFDTVYARIHLYDSQGTYETSKAYYDSNTHIFRKVDGTAGTTMNIWGDLSAYNINVAASKKLNFSTTPVDGTINRINLHNNTFGFGINSSTLAYYAPASTYHKFYVGTTNRFYVGPNGTMTSGEAQFTGYIKFNSGNSNSTSTLIDLGSAFGATAKTCGFGVKDSGTTITAKGTGGLEAVSFNATSDYRVKENVQTISGDIYTVDGLRPVSYILKDSQQPHIGFIAHELQEHIPTAVKGEKDGEIMQTVNYNELIPILVKEIQDLKKEVRQLKERLQE